MMIYIPIAFSLDSIIYYTTLIKLDVYIAFFLQFDWLRASHVTLSRRVYKCIEHAAKESFLSNKH